MASHGMPLGHTLLSAFGSYIPAKAGRDFLVSRGNEVRDIYMEWLTVGKCVCVGIDFVAHELTKLKGRRVGAGLQ